MKSYESIIEGYQAIEMAEQNNCTVVEMLSQWIDNVGYEGEWTEDFNFTNSKYIDETNNGYSIYYNYACDYYFFVDENE